MKIRYGLARLPLVALVASCATVDVLHLDNTARRPKDNFEVQLLLDEPKQPYVAIAVVVASDEGWGLSLDKIKDKLIKEAARLGGDAVIIGRESKEAGAVFTPVGNTFYAVPFEETKLVGKVIVFKGDT